MTRIQQKIALSMCAVNAKAFECKRETRIVFCSLLSRQWNWCQHLIKVMNHSLNSSGVCARKWKGFSWRIKIASLTTACSGKSLSNRCRFVHFIWQIYSETLQTVNEHGLKRSARYRQPLINWMERMKRKRRKVSTVSLVKQPFVDIDLC